MAESKVKDDNYFLTSGWMINRLNLKGVALQVFSIIYGFSQDGETCFTGSLQYLCDFTNASKPTIIMALKDLVDKGYLVKYENEMNGVKFNRYRANLLVVKNLNGGSQESLSGGSKETLPGGSQESLHNKEVIDNTPLISKEIIDLYHSICVSFPRVLKITDKRKEAIRKCLAKYSKEELKTVFENAEQSSFLKGKNDRGWSANFDWLISDGNIVKVLEGNYEDRNGGRKEKVPGWLGFQPGEAEMDAINQLMKDDPDFQREQAQLARELEVFGRKAI